MDSQVKIRGYRVEPGEIEVELRRHPAVQDAVVVAREDTLGQKRLVAYLVLWSGQTCSTRELYRFLQEKLPLPMIPWVYEYLERLPLSPNGKVDRQALPPPRIKAAHTGRIFVAPREELELRLVRIWENILGVQAVGLQDNFFELGGHSLNALELFNAIKKFTGRDLPLATLFDAPTVKDLARVLQQKGWTPTWSSLVPIQPMGSKPPFFCVHALGGHLLIYRDLAHNLGQDQPFYGLQARGLDGKGPYYNRIEDMAVHYIQELQSIQPKGPYYLGAASFGGLVVYEMAQQLVRQGEQIALLAMFNSYAPTCEESPAGVLLWQWLDLHLGNLFSLDFPGKIAYLQTRAKKVLRKRQPFRKRSQRLPSTFRRIEAAHLAASKHYEPEVYSGQIVLFRASRQPGNKVLDPSLGWAELAGGGVEIIEVPGYHNTILLEPRVRSMAEALKRCLAQASQAEPPSATKP
jgi:aspartate racemase